ncbi:MAG TPA: glycosyltransferase family 2 protein [Actinobacteria bacterium]|nr:glycosyltransferase family 2 protein [Actinomycetota bacterium]
MSDVSILILNYNGAKFIGPCLESVFTQDYPVYEVIVIDNGSTDDSVKLVREGFPKARIIETGQNLGFSGGMNLGIREAKNDLLLLLNTDVVLEKGFLTNMVAAITREPGIGSVSSKVYKLAEKEKKIFDTTGHVIFTNRLFTDRGDGELDTGQYDEVEEIFGTCAGTGLYKREMLDDLAINGEYFDESFFMFLEDTDLSWRAQLRGWKCLYTPHAIAWHHRGGSAVRKSKLVELNNYKNRYMMILKNDSIFSLIKNIPHFIVTDTFKSLALLVRCPPALLGWWDVWRNLPSLIRKRRIIQKSRKVSQKEIERWMVPFGYRNWIARHLKGLNG